MTDPRAVPGALHSICSQACMLLSMQDVAFEGADDLLGEYIPSDDDAE